MRRLSTSVACVVASTWIVLGAQTPPAQTPQAPVFRSEVDVIRLDVSVIDKDHRPVRGLKPEDFSVIEDGKSQRVIAVSEIDAAENDPAPSAWMRHVPHDVAVNDLADRVGSGRIFAIVMDDVNVPWDDRDIVFAARAAGRYLVDGLGPSDVAAVMFPFDAGKSQDFTDDRTELIAAIDRFEPREMPWEATSRMVPPSQGGADMPNRSSTALMRSQCQRAQPTVPTLNVLASRLAAIPNRRKTLVLVSTGVPVNMGANGGCQQALADEMRDVFRTAQRGNINIYSVDPAGYRGYESYLQNPILSARRVLGNEASPASAMSAARLRRDFLEITADNTGGRAIVSTDEIDKGIDQIFSENGPYYLLGYQTSNPRPDGKFRRVQVKVNRPGVTIRARSGYFAPLLNSVANPEDRNAPASNDLGMTGLSGAPGVPLRAVATPLGLTDIPGSRDGIVGVVLSVRLPPSQGPMSETLVVTRNIYDDAGKAGPPTQDSWPMELQRSAGDELRYDIYYKLTLPPGRHQIRLNARSRLLDKSGTVFADVDVPDFTRAPLTISGITLGPSPVPARARTDALASMLPVVPTTEREFAPSDAVTAFVRVFEGGTAPIAPVTIAVKLLDGFDAMKFEAMATVPSTAFDATRGAPYQVEIPLGGLVRGPYLLSISATPQGGATVRRDLVFRMK